MFNFLKSRPNVSAYQFEYFISDHVRIVAPGGDSMVVSRDEITRQLNRSDLDPHRRAMYEGAKQCLRKRNHEMRFEKLKI